MLKLPLRNVPKLWADFEQAGLQGQLCKPRNSQKNSQTPLPICDNSANLGFAFYSLKSTDIL